MATIDDNLPLTFTDLFCGIGGFHVAATRLGMRCVFACDIDAEAQRAYRHNFGVEPAGDITQIPPDSIPDHDVLLAGFPCQPFDIIGAMRGFADDQGNLISQIVSEAGMHDNRRIPLAWPEPMGDCLLLSEVLEIRTTSRVRQPK